MSPCYGVPLIHARASRGVATCGTSFGTGARRTTSHPYAQIVGGGQFRICQGPARILRDQYIDSQVAQQLFLGFDGERASFQ